MYEDENLGTLEISEPGPIAFIQYHSPTTPITYAVKGGFTFAQIPASPEVYKLVVQFNSGAMVPANEFLQLFKLIRREMIRLARGA